MPAKNPRLTNTLEPVVAAALRRLSEVTGNSQSSLISELLEGSVPVFQRMIVTLEAAANASAEMRGKLVEDMERAQGRIERQLGFVMDEFDVASAPLLDPIERVPRRRAKGADARPPKAGASPRQSSPKPGSTPLSNRGVRSLTNTGKKHSARSSKGRSQ